MDIYDGLELSDEVKLGDKITIHNKTGSRCPITAVTVSYHITSIAKYKCRECIFGLGNEYGDWSCPTYDGQCAVKGKDLVFEKSDDVASAQSILRSIPIERLRAKICNPDICQYYDEYPQCEFNQFCLFKYLTDD